MRHRNLSPLFAAFAAAALCALAQVAQADDAAAQGVQLAYRFEPGQRLYYSIENSSNVVVQYDVSQHAVQHSSASVKHFRVVDVYENGSAVLRLMIDRAYMRAEQAGSVAVFDSASTEEVPPEFVGVKSTVGTPWIDVTVSPQGEVLDVQPLISGVNNINITNEIQNNVLALLPEGEVKVGDSWNEEYVVGVQIDTMSQLQREIRMQRTFTLESVEDGRAVIALRTISLSPIREPFQEGQLLQRTPSGRIIIDIASGTLVARDLEVDGEAVGFSGPQSCMSVVSTRSERLIDAGEMDDFFARQIAAHAAAAAAAAPVAPAAAQ